MDFLCEPVRFSRFCEYCKIFVCITEPLKIRVEYMGIVPSGLRPKGRPDEQFFFIRTKLMQFICLSNFSRFINEHQGGGDCAVSLLRQNIMSIRTKGYVPALNAGYLFLSLLEKYFVHLD